MIRVTFDHDYIGNLEDYFQRNECIREQQYLSQDKLLHLAAFCVSKVAVVADKSGDEQSSEQKAEATLDAIRQLSVLCQNAVHGNAQIEHVTIVNGRTNEGQNHQCCTSPSLATTWFERCILTLFPNIQSRV